MNSTSYSTTRPEILNFEAIRAIIFDFDGTIVDSEPVWKETFKELFSERYSIDVPMSMLWENTGGGVDFSVRAISNKMDLDMSESEISNMSNDINGSMHEKLLDNFPMRKGMDDLIEWALSNGILLGICTASHEELITQYFEQLSLLHIFSHIESTAKNAHDKRKPYPYPYLESMRSMGVTANQAIAIEDSPKGIISARAANMVTVAIHNPFLEEQVLLADPTIQLKEFHQVLEFLCSLPK